MSAYDTERDELWVEGADEWMAEAMMAQWDDDPNPYSGTYSED